MQIRESEQDRQAYLTRRMSEADIATREHMSKHAREIGLAEGEIKGRTAGRIEGEVEKIHLLQRLRNRPLTPVEELKKFNLPELIALAGQLEQEIVSKKDAP